MAAVLAAQKARTPAVEAKCRRDEHFSARLFEGLYGRERTQENGPRFQELLRAVLATTAEVNEAAKEKFHRPRPYQGHPEVVHALFTVTGYSYPSGHSMASFTLATVLAAVFPERSEALLGRARQIAQSRVDAGVHHPSDIKEGEVLGKATAAAILAAPAFQKSWRKSKRSGSERIDRSDPRAPLTENGQRVLIAGAVICRQRPGTAQGFVFVSLETRRALPTPS